MGLHCKYMINVSDSASGFPSVGCTRSLLLCQEMGATQDKQLPYPIGRVGIDPVEVHKLPHHPWQTHLLPETRQKMGMYWQWKVWLLQCWGCNGEAKGACLHNWRPTKCCSGEAANGEANRCMFTTEGPPNGCCTDEGVNSTVVNGVCHGWMQSSGGTAGNMAVAGRALVGLGYMHFWGDSCYGWDSKCVCTSWLDCETVGGEVSEGDGEWAWEADCVVFYCPVKVEWMLCSSMERGAELADFLYFLSGSSPFRLEPLGMATLLSLLRFVWDLDFLHH